jgi:hypothetical protein
LQERWQSSGGLRFVKAMGVLVEGMAQVSMNLTDFHQTPIARVVELVRREAARHGASITHSELVGLTPAALVTLRSGIPADDQARPDSREPSSRRPFRPQRRTHVDRVAAPRCGHGDGLTAFWTPPRRALAPAVDRSGFGGRWRWRRRWSLD